MNDALETTCCIAGGGPAGMMLGFLLARAGIPVIVLEKHNDFFRDFRGDTIHPSTFSIMQETGLLPDFLEVPHDEQTEVNGTIGGKEYKIASFAHLPAAYRKIGFMPQWDFLNFLLKYAETYPTFRLMTNAEGIDVVRTGNNVTGLKVSTTTGEVTINAQLVVAADGRRSTIAASAGLKPADRGATMDVLWFRLSRQQGDPEQNILNLNAGNVFITITRKDYYQCGFVIEKGSFDTEKSKGLHHFRDRIAGIVPFMKNRTQEITTWEDVKLLNVSVTYLEQWYTDGLLCIGDAAHAMSPIGGVGINLALQDAVAAANLLYKPLRKGTLTTNHLRKVQRRRALPTKVIQQIQVGLQNGVIVPALHSTEKIKPPVFIRLLQVFPPLRGLIGRIIGLGIRPEHVRTPNMH